MATKTVGVIFGGRSAEHEVSIVSAQSIMRALSPAKYTVVPIGITRAGKWLSGPDAMQYLQTGTGSVSLTATISTTLTEQQHIDVFFPVMHGTYGEDGSVQGLLEMLNVPYVGCDVLSSALGMDKAMQKKIWAASGLPVVPHVVVRRLEWDSSRDVTVASITSALQLPYFVKPNNLGSSVGITKVEDKAALEEAMERAFEYSDTALIEAGIAAREIECAVLGNEQPRASVTGEIIPADAFYSFKDKYVDGNSRSVIPAEISEGEQIIIRDYAVKAFTALQCAGMARVDFFLDRTTGKIYLNEINTIPGFTSISMYPKMWEASGLLYSELLDDLIRLGIERWEAKAKLNTSFESKSGWYKES